MRCVAFVRRQTNMIAKTFTLDIELMPEELAGYVAYMDSDQQAEFFSRLAKEFDGFGDNGYAQREEIVRSERVTDEARWFIRDLQYYADM
jgi:hypothetical protein